MGLHLQGLFSSCECYLVKYHALLCSGAVAVWGVAAYQRGAAAFGRVLFSRERENTLQNNISSLQRMSHLTKMIGSN
eukprot:scaffold149_cov179-Amphora_coffeaeformis.AAC.3